MGCEIRKTRPCAVISSANMHKHTCTVIVAPMTSSLHASRYRVPTRFAGRPGSVTLDQVRAIDRRRLVRRVGALDCGALRATMGGIRGVVSDHLHDACRD
nr:type II toxin-antitoxin system PemK/MazF family toxin [Pandoraea cepalis]